MGTKTISIMDDVYKILKKNKKEDESFSDVIRRTCKQDYTRFFGMWSSMSKEQASIMKKTSALLRKNKRSYLA